MQSVNYIKGVYYSRGGRQSLSEYTISTPDVVAMLSAAHRCVDEMPKYRYRIMRVKPIYSAR